MCDQRRRSIRGEFLKAGLNEALCFVIDVAGRLVQYEHFRVSIEGPCDTDPLALPAREFPALTSNIIVLEKQFVYDLMNR